MTDSILSGVVTLGLLIGGTAAIGSEVVQSSRAPVSAAAAQVTMPTVVVTGHRQPADTVIVASR